MPVDETSKTRPSELTDKDRRDINYRHWLDQLKADARVMGVAPEDLVHILYFRTSPMRGNSTIENWNLSRIHMERYLRKRPHPRRRYPCPVCALSRLLWRAAYAVGLARRRRVP